MKKENTSMKNEEKKIQEMDKYCACGHKFHLVFRNMNEFKRAMKISDEMHEEAGIGASKEFTIDVANAITFFRGENYFLSNFFPCTVTYEGITYPTSEHAYQAMKTLKQSIREEISKLGTPGEAKRVGRKIDIRSDWERVKIKIMEEIVWEKFSKHEDLKKLLLSTGDTLLFEGNDWHNDYWGVDRVTLKGKNHLGKILMKTRKRLQEQG